MLRKSALEYVFHGICLLAVGLALYRVTGSAASEVKAEPVRAGATIEVPGVDWTTSERTLVIAVRAGCQWCTASADLYHELVALKQAKFRVIFIGPDDVAVTQKYLAGLEVNASDVRKADFGALGVTGTPTTIIADKGGTVVATWRGKLDPDAESELFKALDVSRAR